MRLENKRLRKSHLVLDSEGDAIIEASHGELRVHVAQRLKHGRTERTLVYEKRLATFAAVAGSEGEASQLCARDMDEAGTRDGMN